MVAALFFAFWFKWVHPSTSLLVHVENSCLTLCLWDTWGTFPVLPFVLVDVVWLLCCRQCRETVMNLAFLQQCWFQVYRPIHCMKTASCCYLVKSDKSIHTLSEKWQVRSDMYEMRSCMSQIMRWEVTWEMTCLRNMKISNISPKKNFFWLSCLWWLAFWRLAFGELVCWQVACGPLVTHLWEQSVLFSQKWQVNSHIKWEVAGEKWHVWDEKRHESNYEMRSNMRNDMFEKYENINY